jgi:hypothetical protein
MTESRKMDAIYCHDKFSSVDCLWFCELCHLTVARMNRKRWWRSHAGYWSRLRPPKRFSREGGCPKFVPVCKTPWRNFCQSRLTKFVNGDKLCVMIKLPRWRVKIVTSFLLIPVVSCWALLLI